MAVALFNAKHADYVAMLCTQSPQFGPTSASRGRLAVDQLTKQRLVPAATQSLESASQQTNLLLCDVEKLEDVEFEPTAVPMDVTFSQGQQAALACRSALRWGSSYLDGVPIGTSMCDIARVFIHSSLVTEMSDRVTGLDRHWDMELSVLVPNFAERVREMSRDMMSVMRQDAEIAMIDCYVRFADWMSQLRLPTVWDVLTWSGNYSQNAASDAVRSMSPVDFFSCMANLRLLVTDSLLHAVTNFVECYKASHEVIFRRQQVHTFMKQTLTTMAEGYTLFRYANVLFMEEARRAVLAYLTCTERVAYAGIIPHRKLYTSNKKKGITTSENVGVRWSNAQPVADYNVTAAQKDTYRYIFHVAMALRQSAVCTDAMPWVAENRLSNGLQGAACALTTCFLWRWLSVVHNLPMMTDTNSSNTRSIAVSELTPFAHRTAPCLSHTPDEPALTQLLTTYIINTLHPSNGEVCPASPYIIVDRTQVPAYISSTFSDENVESRKLMSRRFRRRNTLVITQMKAVTKKESQKRLHRRRLAKWLDGDFAVLVLPKIYATSSAHHEPEIVKNTTVDYDPMLFEEQAPDVPVAPSRPAKYAIVEPQDKVTDHFASLVAKHATVSDKPVRDGLRVRQFIGLVTYHANHCQSERPGLLMRVKGRERLVAGVSGRVNASRGILGGRKGTNTRARVITIKPESELAPLARRMNKKRTADDMLFDHDTSVLHQ